ncbi:MAG: hypothetical protein FP831_12475 [Anaerolineae bacterium]|nr:hypothetical protein [Anaerolineae bacterium]
MIFTGFLSIFQILILPGLIFNAFIKKEAGILYRISFILAFSMLFNLLYNILLVSLHAYNFYVILITILVEIAFILFLYRKLISQPVGKIFSLVNAKFKTSLEKYFDCEPGKPIAKTFLSGIKILALLLAMFSVGWVIVEFIQQSGSVFGYWDSVISYNRWATEWSKGLIPTGATEYPQLLPINWSITYVLTQSQVVIFAKLIQGIFPILFLLVMLDLGLTIGSAGFLFGVPLSFILLKKFAVVSIFEGFMDVAVTTYILLALYIIYKDFYNNRYSHKTLWLSGIVILAAAMTKQPGVLAFGSWVLINFFLTLSKNQGKVWISLKKVVVPTLVIMLMIASWYFFKMNRDAMLGEQSSIVITNSWAISDLFSGYWEKFLYRIKLLDLWIVFIPILFISVFLAKREIKLLLLCFGIPYLVLSFFYGLYIMFIRYLTPISFVVAISASVLIDYLITKFLDMRQRFPSVKIQTTFRKWISYLIVFFRKSLIFSIWSWVILGLLIIVIFGLKYPDAKLVRNYEYQQMGIGNRSYNEYLVDFYNNKDPNELTISWYPYVNYLPGLQGRAIELEYFEDVESFKNYLKRDELRYVLQYNSTPSDIAEYILTIAAKGQLTFITDFGVKNDAVLYEVVR